MTTYIGLIALILISVAGIIKFVHNPNGYRLRYVFAICLCLLSISAAFFCCMENLKAEVETKELTSTE